MFLQAQSVPATPSSQDDKDSVTRLSKTTSTKRPALPPFSSQPAAGVKPAQQLSAVGFPSSAPAAPSKPAVHAANRTNGQKYVKLAAQTAAVAFSSERPLSSALVASDGGFHPQTGLDGHPSQPPPVPSRGVHAAPGQDIHMPHAQALPPLLQSPHPQRLVTQTALPDISTSHTYMVQKLSTATVPKPRVLEVKRKSSLAVAVTLRSLSADVLGEFVDLAYLSVQLRCAG